MLYWALFSLALWPVRGPDIFDGKSSVFCSKILAVKVLEPQQKPDETQVNGVRHDSPWSIIEVKAYNSGIIV